MSEGEIQAILIRIAELSKTVELSTVKTEDAVLSVKSEIGQLKSLIQGTERGKGIVRIMENLETRITVLEREVKDCVKQDEFRSIRMLVYGAAGVLLAGVLGAIVTVVLK